MRGEKAGAAGLGRVFVLDWRGAQSSSHEVGTRVDMSGCECVVVGPREKRLFAVANDGSSGGGGGCIFE